MVRKDKKSSGILIGHPRSGTSYIKRFVRLVSDHNIMFSYCGREAMEDFIVGNWVKSFLPCHKVRSSPPDNVALIERDPRDVAVSAWFFVYFRIAAKRVESEQVFVDRVMPHILEWRESSHQLVPPERRIQFTRMKEPGEILRIIEAMGSRESEEGIIERTIGDFAFEKNHEKDKRGVYGDQYIKSGGDERSLSIRNGESGQWNDFPADFSAWGDF